LSKLYQFNVNGSEREYELGKWKHRDYTPNTSLSVSVARFGEPEWDFDISAFSLVGSNVVLAQSGLQKVNHVIIVMQENHSFDNYFGAVAYQATGVAIQNAL